MMPSMFLKSKHLAKFHMGILSAIGVLESLLRAVMLQNRAQLGLGVIIIQKTTTFVCVL